MAKMERRPVYKRRTLSSFIAVQMTDQHPTKNHLSVSVFSRITAMLYEIFNYFMVEFKECAKHVE